MEASMKKYGFRWRVFRWVYGEWTEPFRYHPTVTLSMLEMVWDRAVHGPGGERWLYIILPGIVDVTDHNWAEPRKWGRE